MITAIKNKITQIISFRVKLKTGQTITELAIFGTVLVFVIGVIVSYTLSFNSSMKLQMLAFRKALQLAHDTEVTRRGNDLNTSIVLLEDRNTPDLSNVFGIMQRSSIGASANVTYSHNSYKTAGFCDDVKGCDRDDIPLIHIFVNGKEFKFTTGSFKRVTCRNDSCPTSAPFPNELVRYKFRVTRGSQLWRVWTTGEVGPTGCTGTSGRAEELVTPYEGSFTSNWAMCATRHAFCPYNNWNPRSKYFYYSFVDLDCDDKEEQLIGYYEINSCNHECFSAFDYGLSVNLNVCNAGDCYKQAMCWRDYGMNYGCKFTDPANCRLKDSNDSDWPSWPADYLTCARCYRQCLINQGVNLQGGDIDNWMDNLAPYRIHLISIDSQEGEIDFTRNDYDIKVLHKAKQGLLTEEEVSSYKVEPGTQIEKREDSAKTIHATQVKRKDIISRVIQLNPQHTTVMDPDCSADVLLGHSCWSNVVKMTAGESTVGNCLGTNQEKTCFDPGVPGDEMYPPRLYIRSNLKTDKTAYQVTPKKR